MALLDPLRRWTFGRPAFGLFLLAVAAMPFRWLSPLGSLNARAGWSDVLMAAAVAAWGWEKRHRRWRPIRRWLQPWHAGLAAYLVLAGISTVLSRDRGTAGVNLLLMTELVASALLAVDFGSQRSGRRAIAWAVIGGTLVTGVLAAVALSLFYAGIRTSLLAPYAGVLTSDFYARVRAGFYSAPLLASYCIFASAMVAMEDTGLARRSRRVAQAGLGALALVALSRGLIGFLAAAVVRVARNRNTPRWRAAAIAGVSAALLAMVVLTVAPPRPDAAHLSTLIVHVPDRQLRYGTLTSSLDTVWKQPLFGIGPGLLPGRIEQVPVRAHFTPVNVAATVGIPALCALAFVVAWAWRRRYRPTDIAIWSGLLGLAIDGLGQDIDHFRHVWILLGLALARTTTRA